MRHLITGTQNLALVPAQVGQSRQGGADFDGAVGLDKAAAVGDGFHMHAEKHGQQHDQDRRQAHRKGRQVIGGMLPGRGHGEDHPLSSVGPVGKRPGA